MRKPYIPSENYPSVTPSKVATFTLLIIILFFGNHLQGQNLCSSNIAMELGGNLTEEEVIRAGTAEAFSFNIQYKQGTQIKVYDNDSDDFPLFDYTVEIYTCQNNNATLITTLTIASTDNSFHSLDSYLTGISSCPEKIILNINHNGQRIASQTDNSDPPDGDFDDPEDVTVYDNEVNTFIEAQIISSCVLGGSIQFGAADSYPETSGTICQNAPGFTLKFKDLYNNLDNVDVDPICFGEQAQQEWYYQNIGENEVQITATNGTFTLNPQDLNLGLQKIKCYVIPPGNGCERLTLERTIDVVEDPIVQFTESGLLIDSINDNYVFSLKEFLSDNSTSFGTSTVIQNNCSTCVEEDIPNSGTFTVEDEGCYTFTYTADDLGDCVNPNPSASLDVQFVFEPNCNFLVSGGEDCQNTSFDFELELTNRTNNTAYTYSIQAGQRSATGESFDPVGSPQTGSFGGNNTVTISNFSVPNNSEYRYEIIVSGQRASQSFNCGGFSASSETMNTSRTKFVYTYNDGNDCGCELEQYDVCEISTNDYFNISCSFFDIDLFRVLGPNPMVASNQYVNCNEPDVTLDSYDTQFLGFDPNDGVGGSKIEDLPGADIICDVFNFCICVGWLGIEIRPFRALYEAIRCGDTVSEVLFEMLGALLGGDGGGGQIVADTNGDGTFDYLVAEGAMPMTSGGESVKIPNRVGTNGILTARMVEGWPNTPTGTCGDVTVPGMDLFELLPIGAIPVVGIIIEEILQTAGCGSDLSWSTYTDLQYYIYNEAPPVFTNCPDGQTIMISEDYSCESFANWDFPIALDGCYGEAIEQSMNPMTYANYQDYLDTGNGSQGEAGVWRVDNSAQTGGVLIESGDNLAADVYPIIYYAENCSGTPTHCEFNVQIGPGDPELVVPYDLSTSMDIDSDQSIVTGLEPLSGTGCGTSIYYSTTGELSISGWNDISGTSFPKGSTTVTYRMRYQEPNQPDSTEITSSFDVEVLDRQYPTAICNDFTVQLPASGTVSVLAAEIDAGSFDNDAISAVEIRKADEISYSPSVDFDCMEEGPNTVVLRVTDLSLNEATCLATIFVEDFFKGFDLTMDLPELCFEANNPIQFDFANYLQIQNPYNGGAILPPSQVGTLGSNIEGFFAITSFVPNLNAPNSTTPQVGTNPNNPGDIGYIDLETGMYTPGTGSGFVTVSYLLTNTNPGMIQQNEFIVEGCFKMVHETFELRQPVIVNDDIECSCGDFTSRSVDLGDASGGLEPYTIQYSGATLDHNGDGLADDFDGTHTYDNDLSDFTEDLGALMVDYNTPVWSFTIVDARGCEVFRSGSCDNDDQGQSPTIICPPSVDITTDPGECSAVYNWQHPNLLDSLIYDNCAVAEYSYFANLADHTLLGPMDLQVLLNIDSLGNTDVDSIFFEAALDFPHGVNEIWYYAEDATGNFIECTFTVTVTDPENPVYTNCPYPDITVNTENDSCYAYVNFALPEAEDNCQLISNIQIDDTGLSTGSAFPLGTTVMTWEATDKTGNTSQCTVTVNILDEQSPVAACQDVSIQLDDQGQATVYSDASNSNAVYIDANSWDNCGLQSLLIAKFENGAVISSYELSQSYDCNDIGNNQVQLLITDSNQNTSTCIANIEVLDFFEGVQLSMDIPEICLDENNPTQLDLTNYLIITLPDGSVLSHQEVASHPFFGAAEGNFGITIFDADPAYPGSTAGTITADGIYTPGNGSGFVTVSYVLSIPGASGPQNGNDPVEECMLILHETFEIRQALDMGDPMCLCGDFTERTVDLGIIEHGLEPYTINYNGTRLDVDGDGNYDDTDGEYTYSTANGHDITDFQEDLGILRVDYTQPTWSFTITDARGCVLSRSGSCDNDDASEAPSISCPQDIGVVFTDVYVCTSFEEWLHPDVLSGGIYDNCMITEYNFSITDPDGDILGPFDLDPLLNIYNDGSTDVDQSLFEANYDFPQGVSTVFYYVEDATGNFMECTFTVTVEDNLTPIFLNCPYPPVVENTETDHCDAYVNFAVPLAEDNCDVPTVVQIDNTGLTTGDRFPAGTTIMYWEASDLSGNKDTCQVKVIVNDYWNVPEIVCPDDVLQTTDEWRCDAKVYNIDAEINSICQDNLSLTYEIFSDEALTNRIECGVGDASGEIFDKGDSWVRYTVKSQPLLLISEISQGNSTDQLEIVNLGPASIDINCLEVVRTSIDPSANETLPMVTNYPALTPTTLASGEVMVFDFSYDAAESTPACYAIQFMGTVIDQVAVNGDSDCLGFSGILNGGNVYRHCEADTDDAADWAVEENCSQLTIGALNPDLEALADNGSTTSLQSEAASSSFCVFKVSIMDDEDPFCGELNPSNNLYTGPGLSDVNENQCNRSAIEISEDCIIGQISLDLQGDITVDNAVLTLISPEGDLIAVDQLADDLFDDLYTIKSGGTWTLDIAPTESGSFTLDSWSLDITCMDPFIMDDVLLENDPGLCGAQYDWTHPWFVDNCIEGSISVQYLSDDADCVPESGALTDFGGYDVSEFFCVGTTTVLYTLIDEAGNDHQCSFEVTVEDTEAPVVVCPDDMIINLDGGLCRIPVCYEPLSATDNCAVVDTVYSVEPCSDFEIGITTVEITIYDEAGNTDNCSFTVEVIEYVPQPYVLICNDLVNVSLGVDCIEMLSADMILEGNNYHCYEDYQITILDANGFPTPNSPFVDVADVGENFTAWVYDPDSGNSCLGEIHIMDHNIPQLECPADITVKCHESTDEAYTGEAILTSCEASVEWFNSDEWVDLGDCNDVRGQMIRVWTVVDESGNSNTCTQTITVERILLNDIVFPTNFDGLSNPEISCDDLAANPELTSPEYTGIPLAFGADFDPADLCGLSVLMEDQVFDICGGAHDILRLWSVYDPCLPAIIGVNPKQYIQTIKVKDLTTPSISCPDDLTISVDPGIGCTATYDIPPATITDACSNYSVITTMPYGSIYGNGGTIYDLPRGTFDIKYQAIDDCGNESKCEYKLTVIDSISPDMVCIEFTDVTLNTGGEAIVYADHFDSGSHDNCCLELIEVARMDDGVFGESVAFDCEDDIVMVILKGTDCYGNANQCMVEVDVDDKFEPTIICPANEEINCSVYLQDYAALLDEAVVLLNNNPNLSALEAFAFLELDFGQAFAVDNCEADLNLSVDYGIDQCGVGYINRTWTSEDPSANQAAPCIQTIDIGHLSSWTVNFPEDWAGELDADCNIPDIQYGETTIQDDDCEMIAISYEDDIFLTANNACYKIFRTWTAINWCTYDGNNSTDYGLPIDAADHIYSVSGTDYITHTQILNINDTTVPQIEDQGDIAIDILEACAADFELPAPVVNGECTGYEYVINSTDLAPYQQGSSYTAVPEGEYSITYQVTDDCGNISFHTTTVLVSDAKKPTAYCTDQLVIDIMPDGNGGGMIQVNAVDFNHESFDNCTAQADLQFSLSADISETSLSFDCSQIGIQMITLYVWDEAGNTDFCEVELDIQDNNQVCGPGTLSIAGGILTADNEAVENVQVEINGGAFSATTDVSGQFLMEQLPAGGDYSVIPQLDSNPSNGVTTFDIVLITKHILGLQALDTPYKLIAADANNSGTVSTLDLVDIRKLILGLYGNYPNNQSWRFIQADYVFPEPTNPWTSGFPEVINFNNLAQSDEANFIAVKIGDVNGSAQSHSFSAVEERDEQHPFILKAAEKQLYKGQVVSIPFYTETASIGFQLSLNMDAAKVRLENIDAGILDQENFGTAYADDGILCISWNAESEKDLSGTDLFSLNLTILEDCSLEEVLSINSRITAAEAYSNAYPLQTVELQIGDQFISDKIHLYQNRPNPFSDRTRIGFYLPQADNILLEIRDVNGKLIQSLQQTVEKGYNEVDLRMEETGVYYYTLKTETISLTRKMIHIE